MRAAAASAIRRLFPRCSTSISISGRSQWHSQNQSRYHFNPHWDYSNRPAGPRALLNFSPCHPRGSSSLSPPPTPAVASLLFFSSLSGTEDEQEEEAVVVLDMEAGTVRCAANHAPLSPISFIERAAVVYGPRPAVVYGDRRHTWAEVRGRCLRVAAALATRFGVARGDVVAVLSPNVPAMYELHFAVPMAGAVLCTFNTRHDTAMVSVLLKHSGAKVFLVESNLLDIGRAALKLIGEFNPDAAAALPVLLTISDDTDSDDYEDLVRNGHAEFDIRWPADELDPISLNYTSGTTSRPKGVVYSHRGAYLNTIATVLAYDITAMPTYLWTVPMFHCNGWNLPWGVAMQGGTNVCLRRFTAKDVFDGIARWKVTHLGGAPTVLSMIVNAPAADRQPLPATVRVITGGAPPLPGVLVEMERLGFVLYHVYGLTETCGVATVCAWTPEWDAFPAEERARLKARQGCHHFAVQDADVKDPETMESVPRDGRTMGEVMFRGNTMAGGWLHTGDLAVRHPDGSIQVKDRAKDIIISGGENVSSIEVETLLSSHPAVLEAAVVARPDDHWGETPCAFVKLKDGASATEAEIIGFCRERLPHYMAPRTVVFEDLPKTSTGKTQKFVLRGKAQGMGSLTKSDNGRV